MEERKAKEDGAGLGREEFEGVCAKCHRLDGSALVGPSLRNNPTLTDRRGLETLLRNGGVTMPPVGRGWSDAQIDALVAYAKTIGKAPSGG